MYNFFIDSPFKSAVTAYCQTQDYQLALTEPEYSMLQGYIDSTTVTPEAREIEAVEKYLHFEIKRGLARRQAFECLLRGREQDYRAFIVGQPKECTLSRECFDELSREANTLPASLKDSIRISCFLSINNHLKAVLKKNEIVLSEDSEEFLTQLIPVIMKKPELFEFSARLTTEQFSQLEKMYWPTTHCRHMMYTEGGDSMSASLTDAVQKGLFTKADFSAWRWRWLTNLFGFQGGPGAKYYDANTHELTSLVMNALQELIDYPHQSFLDHYLNLRAEKAGFRLESEIEREFLGHLAAYFHQVHIITPDLGQLVMSGYQQYQANSNDQGELARLYRKFRQDKTNIVPTYVPAVLNNAYYIFLNKFEYSKEKSISVAVHFMCEVLSVLHQSNLNYRISLMNFAKVEQLYPVLQIWLEYPEQLSFEIRGDEWVTQSSPKVERIV